MKWRRRRLTSVLLSLVLAGGLAACSNASQPSAQPEGEGQGDTGAEVQELTLSLDWYPNAVHLFLLAAEEQGYFQEEQLKVTLQMPSEANDPLKMAAAGKVDLAISYQPIVVQARSEEIPVVSVAALVRHTLDVIMTRQDSGIDHPAKLAGKSVGYPSVPLEEAIVRNVVRAAGGDDNSLVFTDIGFDIVPALTAQKVDAVSGGYLNHEAVLLEKHGVPVHVFKPADFGVPDYYELVLVTSEATLAKKEQAIKAFLRAAAKGQAWVQANREQALQLLLSKQAAEFPLEEDVEKRSLEILLPLMDAGDKPFGSQDAETWQRLIDWMKQEQLIQRDVKPEDAMRNLVE